MHRTHRTAVSWRRAPAALVAISLLAAACGNAGDDDAEPVEGSVAQPTEVAATDLTDDTGGDTTDDTTGAPPSDPATTDPPTATPAPTDAAPATAPADEVDEPELGEFQPITGVPGVTDESISYAVMGTGPANPLGYCLLECFLGGVQAYFDYRNSIGGVHGRDLVIGRTDDDQMANTQVTLLEIIDDSSMFGVLAAPLLYSGFADLAEAGVPTYTTFPAAPEVGGHVSTYVPVGIGCITCTSPMTALSATLSGRSKVASIGLGVSQASKDCVDRIEAEVNEFGPAVGVEFVYKNNELPFGFPNGLAPEVTAMKEAGVDFITTCIDQNSVIILEQELERQGLGDTTVVLPQGYGDTAFLEGNAELIEGNLVGVAYRPFEADLTGTIIPTMLEWFERVGVLANDYAVQGWLGADLAVTGLLAAGPQFDRATVVDATNQITDYTAGGILPPVDWTRGHVELVPGDPATFCLSYVRVTGGAAELVGDPAEPWNCFDLPAEVGAEPTTYG